MKRDDIFVMGIFGFFLFIGACMGVIGTLSKAAISKEDCEKGLPREQQCVLKWVKPTEGE